MNRKSSSLATTLCILAVSAGIFALGGCASTTPSAGKDRALVCPQCKMVAKTVERTNNAADENGTPGQTYTDTIYTHACPGCQGAIKSFFKEGKLRHKCSVCKETPFTCPIFHPIKKG